MPSDPPIQPVPRDAQAEDEPKSTEQTRGFTESFYPIIVTGLSGAGRSSLLDILEDAGYARVDNLPLRFLQPLLRDWPEDSLIAVGIDSRSLGFAPDSLKAALQKLKKERIPVRLWFLDTDDDELFRRFSVTRRHHPFLRRIDADQRVEDAIRAERMHLRPLVGVAEFHINTSGKSLPDLKKTVEDLLARSGGQPVRIHVQSFSYRAGLPSDADMVFDARFIPNPYHEPALREFDGRNAAIGQFIDSFPMAEAFFRLVTSLVQMALDGYRREGRPHATFAFGCTGGKHRSVHFAERLVRHLAALGFQPDLWHRSLDPRSSLPASEVPSPEVLGNIVNVTRNQIP